ncbi:MAG: hypothetical protein IJB23_00580 [Alistipes sp.]|nr:hypothetical protein [Alistipes sp.]
MKAINKFFYALLAFATVGMVACSEDLTHEAGPAELEGCYDVYFPDASVLETQGPMGEVSLDPSEATVFTYSAYRNNVDGEITVPVEISKNTTDKDGNAMFTVDPIVFADGEDVAEFTVTLSDKAEVGVPYTFELSIVNDPQYVKQYDTNNATTFSVTINRVKWIDLGECAYTDDVVTSWWGVTFSGEWAGQTHPTYNVKVQVRADSINEDAFNAALEGTGEDAGLAGIYRMVNAYRVGPWGDDSDEEYNAAIEANPIYTIINATPYDKAYIPLQELGLTINGGMVSIYSYPAALSDLNRADDITDDMYGKIENGALTFPVEALLGCPGGSYVGKNTYPCNYDGAFKLVLSPALGVYELAMPDAEEDGDFSFSEVELPENALFYSESQAASWVPVLEKGRCEVSTKDADRLFYKEYGLLYRLPDLYEAGYPIYFSALEDGTVTLPKQYINQATGLVQNGYEVKMAIDTEASKFDPATGLLTLVAEFYSGKGEDAVSYGVFEEIIAVEAPEFPVQPMLDLQNDFVYAPFYTAPLTSEFMDSEFDVTLEKGTCINPALTLDGAAYRLSSLYTNGYDIYFVADSEGNVGTAAGYELQPTGVNIYGKAAYMQILSGTCNEKTTILKAKFCDVEGNTLVPALCTETIVNYTWVEVATGSYYSSLYTTETEDGQVAYVPFTDRKLYMAEGTNLYRIENYMGEGSQLNFSWDKTTNKCEIIGFNDTGFDAANFGSVGNIFACDFRTFYQWIGQDYTWEDLAGKFSGDVQPYYDPAANEFVFYVQLTAPEMGVGMALGSGYVEYFSIDGAISEGAQWVDVATGSWECTVLEDPLTGLVLQNKEGTNNYRVVDFMSAATGVTGKHFEFTWDRETNLCELNGFVDTGILASNLGVQLEVDETIHFVDEKTFWNNNGYPDDTWESLAAEYGASVQPFFEPEYNAFAFRVSYYLPNVDGPIQFTDSEGQKSYFTYEFFYLDVENATPASMAAAEEVFMKPVTISGIATTIIRNGKVAPKSKAPVQRTVKSASKASFSKAEVNTMKTVVRSLKTVTPVKREMKVKAF